MLKLNDKEYNLDNLLGINFDLLKEILLKLSKSDNDIIIEINDIKNSNISRNDRISALEQKITELNNNINNINNALKEKGINININEINNKPIQIGKNKEKRDNENINPKSDEDENNPNIEKDLKIKNETMTIKNMKSPKSINKINEIKEKTFDKKFPHISSFYNINPRINKRHLSDINLTSIRSPLLSPRNNGHNLNNESIMNIMQEINELKDHINLVEKNLLKKNAESLQNAKDLLAQHNIQSKSKFSSIQGDINKLNINQKQLDKALSFLAQKFEDKSSISIAKTSLPEIIQIYNNNDDDDNENKIQMTKTFYDSVNKRFEFNNEKYLKLFEENHKIKQDIANVKGLFDNLNRQIDSLKNDTEDINDNIKRIKDKIKELNSSKNAEKITTNDNLPMKDLEEINKYIDKKLNELIEQILEKKEDPNKKVELIGYNPNKKDKALLKVFNKRLNEFNEKLTFMEEDSIKKRKKINSRLNEVDDMFNKMEKINKALKEKSDKKELNALYDLNKKNNDELNKMKLTMEELSLSQEKLRDAFPNFTKRVETLTYEIMKIKEVIDMPTGDFQILRNEYHTKVEEHNKIEFNEEKVKHIMTPLAEEIKKLIDEIKNINTKIKNITEDMKSYSKKKYIEALENNLNEKIYSIDNLLDSKYLKKSDFQKIVKTIDIQIKQLQGNNTNNNNNSVLKQEGENWLLAKQPIKCFNCASCEANVSNTLQQNEYLPRNKYHGQYRIGQGFSKLLQKLENKNDDEKDKDNNKQQEKNKIFNSSFDNNENMDQNFFIIKNNLKHYKKTQYLEDKPNVISLRKNKLPRLIESFKRKQKSTDYIPISDDEKEEVINIVEHTPQILKITKLKNDDIINQNIFEFNNLKNKTGRNAQSKSINVNQAQSLPLNENKDK